MSLRLQRVKVNLRRVSGTRSLRRKLAASRVILVLSIRARPSTQFCSCFDGSFIFFFFRIAVHPAGTGYASGGEDGFVRVHHFDESFFKAKPYGDLEIND